MVVTKVTVAFHVILVLTEVTCKAIKDKNALPKVVRN